MRPLFRSNIESFPSSRPRPTCLRHSRPETLPSTEETTAHVENAEERTAAGPALLAADDKGRCLLCRQEKAAARRYRCKVVVGLIFPFALQALDVTIIASALPWIATDFGAVSQLNWIISAFNLTAAAFIPFWGQVADIVGRHVAIQTAIVSMMVGSALCTAAPLSALPVLLLGRAIQGVGCAGLNVVVRVILLDRVSLRENARNWSIFSFTAGMSYGIGPVIGGALTNINWRWCFAINLPICVAALLLIYFVLSPELLGAQEPVDESGEEDPQTQTQTHSLSQRLATVDVGGQTLFLLGLGLLILALTWAGATYSWASAPVLVPLVVGLVLTASFIGYELLIQPGRLLARLWPRQKPILPWKLLASKDIGLLFYINFATGAAMYSVLYFCNLYFTMVKLYGPTYAGTQLLYYTPGLGVGVYLSTCFLNAWPRKTFVPFMLGSVVEAVGVGVLGWALWSGRVAVVFGMMALTGAGTGLRLMPGSLHAVGFFPRHVATVVALMAVALPLGGTLALTVMSTVFNNTTDISSSSPLRNVATLRELPPDMRASVAHTAQTGIVWAFVSITPFMVLCVIAATFLGNVDIAKDRQTAGGEEVQGGHVTHSIYLAVWFRRWRKEQVLKQERTQQHRRGNPTVFSRDDEGGVGRRSLQLLSGQTHRDLAQKRQGVLDKEVEEPGRHPAMRVRVGEPDLGVAACRAAVLLYGHVKRRAVLATVARSRSRQIRSKRKSEAKEGEHETTACSRARQQ